MLKAFTTIAITLMSTVVYCSQHEQKRIDKLPELVIDKTMTFDNKELNCLGEAIYREARGESLLGQVFVAEVILNRVKHPDFPKTICDVTHQKSINSNGKLVCQFSWNCMKLPPIAKKERFVPYTIAKFVYNGTIERNVSKGSLYFFSKDELKYVKNMKIVRVAQFGKHIGFKNKA